MKQTNRINRLLLLCIFVAGSFSVSAKKVEIAMTRVWILNDYVEVSVPADFTTMKDSEITKKYGSTEPPQTVYTNADATIRVAFGTRKGGAVEYQFKTTRAKLIEEWTKNDPGLKVLADAGTTVDGKDVGYVSVMHKTPEMNYRFLFIADYRGMQMVGELICPKKEFKTWSGVAETIMNTMDFK